MKFPTASSILLFCFFNYHCLYSQPTKNSIEGAIQDSSHQQYLPFVSIQIFIQGSNKPLQSIYANNKGLFQFIGLDSGRYIILFSHVGYMDKKISCAVKNSNIQLGNVYLTALPGTLQSVMVTSKKKLIEQNDEKTIYNVAADPNANTQTAINLLRKTPFVSVDADGNIQLNGQSNFIVLLNGKETAMFAKNVKEALKAFPGSIIAKIEVITQPSAKYDAEGVGGIINIVTKKKVSGYNNTFNLSNSSVGFYNGSVNTNIKSGKLGVSFNYSVDGTRNVKGSNKGTTIALEPSYIKERKYDGKRELTNFWNATNLEAAVEIDSLNTLSTYANVDGNTEHNINGQNFITAYANTPNTESMYELDNKSNSPTYGVGSDYVRKFKSHKEKEFNLRWSSINSITDKELNSSQINDGLANRYVINTNTTKNKQLTFQTDFILPLKKECKLETGLKAIFRTAQSNYESRYKTLSTSTYTIDKSNTDKFGYVQNVYSAYSTYKFKLKNTTFRTGLRYEYTTIDGNFSTSLATIQQHYHSLLPNLQANFKLGSKLNFSLNYNKRLQRPYIWNLNPSVNNNDSLNISYGNPNLQPQSIHNISLQTKISKGNTFAGITLSGSYTGNLIVQYSTFDKNSGITQTTSSNIGKEIQLSLNLNINSSFEEKADVSINGNIRYNQVQNNVNGLQSNSGIGGYMNMNTSYNITKQIATNGYAGFWKAPVSIQGNFGMQYWYGIGFSYKMFKESVTANVSGINFLQKMVSYTNVFTDALFKTTRTNTLPFGGIELAITWNFGKLTEGTSKKKGVKNDDLLAPAPTNN